MRPRLPLLGLALAAIIGVSLADFVALGFWWPLAVFAAATLVCLYRPLTWACLIAACAAFASLHTMRFRESPARIFASRLTKGPEVATATGIVWSDPEPLSYFSLKQSGTFRLRVAQLQLGDESHPADFMLLTTWAGPPPAYGDRVTVRGSLAGLEPPRNPGQFDYAQYLRRTGIFARLQANYPADCRIERHAEGRWLVSFAITTSHWMRDQLALDLADSPEVATLIASMVLGLRGDTPDELKDIFRTTGTLHLFAVSGLNIAMLAIIAAYVLKPFGLGRKTVAAVTIPILLFYALVTGLSASCVRAAMMGSLILIALLVERPALVYNSLAAAVLLILAWDTNQLFVPGFQFSFVLVAVIVWLADKISKRLEPLGAPDPFVPKPLWNWRQRGAAFVSRLLAASIGLTLAAWIASSAFTAGYFHLFSPSAVLANMIAVPIAFLVLALGVAAVVAALIAKPLAIIFNNANWLCAKALLASVQMFALVPGGHLYVETPHAKPPLCEMTILDVGDGASIHLRSGPSDWLIDGGSNWRYGGITLPYLRSRGVNWIDGLVLSHGDAQHIASAFSALDDLAPRTIFDTAPNDRSTTRRKFHAELARRNRGEAFLQRGDELPLGSARARVLFPPVGWQRATADDKALVLLIECRRHRVLLMSDSGLTTERWLMENDPALRADVVVKGHHSKDFSGTTDFLDLVQPQAIVVGNPGHARLPQSLDDWTPQISERRIEVFRQDQCGAVAVEIREEAIAVTGFLTGQSFRSRAR